MTFVMAAAGGLDLSLTASGLALSTGQTRLIGSTAAITTLPVCRQIQMINGLASEILEFMESAPLRLVVVEGLDMSHSYGGSEQRAWLWEKVVSGLMRRSGLQVFVAPSPRVKMFATGSGAAKKGEVIDAVARRWPQFDTRGNDNLADAAVMAMMAAAILDRHDGREVDMPATHLRALAADNVVRSIDQAPPKKGKK